VPGPADAYDSANAQQLERALRDLDMARDALRSNAVFDLVDLEVSITAGYLFEELGEPKKARDHWSRRGGCPMG